MNIKNTLFISLLICSQILIAQTADNRFSLGINLLKNEYNGEYGNGLWNLNNEFYGGGALSLGYYLNRSFDMGLQGSYGSYGNRYDEKNRFFGNKYDGSLFFHYKLNNGYILKETAKLSPFITAGLGFAGYSTRNDDMPPSIITDKMDFVIPVGLGLKYQFTRSFAIQYQYLYNITSSDIHDENQGPIFGKPNKPAMKSGNDVYGQHLFGFVFTLGKAKDSDKDGIPDKKDKCNDTPANVQIDALGCPVDSDNDGVADYLDKCNDTPAGVKVDGSGCPADSDKDGVADNIDKCPSVAGLAKFNGCPDTDGDGVQDSEDKCPTVAGLAKFKGCPDTDGDGVQDSEDSCPKVAGLANFKGCPDTDGDGIPDNLDKCPTEAGIAENKGCPEVKAESKAVFEQALKGIQFESGKDIIKKTSFPILNKVVNVLKENKAFNLEINGHTDSQGNDATNMTMSLKRANAVKAYLEGQGIDPSRLTTNGFGETMPIANNATTQGRATNRRVEFKILF